jgi:biotin synthase
METIFQKIEAKEELSREEIVKLLSVDNTSRDYYRLLYLARKQSEEVFKNQGIVFAQIGINAEPCPINCKFCSMAAGHYALPDKWRKSIDEIIEGVKILVEDRVDDVFLMTTADYPIEQFFEIGRAVRPYIPSDIRLVANIGDFDLTVARTLKDIGFTGAYHIIRLREGVDTGAPVAQRLKTLDAIKAVGMEFYYCVEPIGAEHTYEEMVDEMFRAKEYKTDVMAVMGRTPIPGSPLFNNGTVTALELCKITAVTQLVVQPTRAMNIHEVSEMAILAGVNLLCAEAGANPRDTVNDTESGGRGYTVPAIRKLLQNAGYTVKV